MQWRLLKNFGESEGSDISAHTGSYNMAVDKAILAEVEAGKSPPTFRLYGWSPACISLGHSQKPSQELDLERVQELGYDIVIRPTGGRAVLHISELTYSLIASHDAESWCQLQETSYRKISEAVAAALNVEGFGITLDRGYPVEKPNELRAMTPCFSSTARSEVVWGERKLVGSAQRRLRKSFLQHGSILISKDHRKIVDCLRLDLDRKKKYLEILDQNAVSLEEIIAAQSPSHPQSQLQSQPDSALTWQKVGEGFAERFAQALSVNFVTESLTSSENAAREEFEFSHA